MTFHNGNDIDIYFVKLIFTIYNIYVKREKNRKGEKKINCKNNCKKKLRYNIEMISRIKFVIQCILDE